LHRLPVAARSLIIVLALTANPARAYEPYLFKTGQPQIIVFPNVFLTPARLQNTRLFRLARYMQQQDHEQLLNFVKISLDEMAAVYYEEALQAREKSLQSGKDRDKLIRWSRNSLAFANRLQDLGNRVHPGSEVELYFESFGVLYILVEGKPVLVSSPVINRQQSLEQRIINRVCRDMSCPDQLLQQSDTDLPRNLWVHARWEISDNGRHVLKTKKGLNFIFPDLQDKQRRQRVCLNIARDLNLVADALRDAGEKGLFIDWGYLYLDVAAGTDKHDLVINQFKDAIRLSLAAIPWLNDYPQVVIPWLQARMEFRDYQFDFYNARELVTALSK